MIVAERKPIQEILEMIAASKRVLVLACGGCVTVCLTGGEKQAEELKSAIHAILVGVVPKLMEDEDTDLKNIVGVGCFELNTEVFPYVAAADQETFYKFLREGNNGGLIKETIHPKTLQAFVKEQLENGVSLKDFTDNGCKVGLVPTAKLKAAKKK